MKRPVVLLLSFLFLCSCTGFATAAFDPVLDTDGNKLKRGAEYYILPNPGTGGGLTLDSRPNASCPLYVSKQSSKASSGLPVMFYPFDRDNTVRVATDANFVFAAGSLCVQTTQWGLMKPDKSTGRIYIATGGVIGRTGREGLADWFRVEKLEGGGYKLAYCPQPAVCRDCGRPLCGDLGLFVEDGKVWLGYGGSPFPVMFKKA